MTKDSPPPERLPPKSTFRGALGDRFQHCLYCQQLVDNKDPDQVAHHAVPAHKPWSSKRV